jgi:hypothetical protein
VRLDVPGLTNIKSPNVGNAPTLWANAFEQSAICKRFQKCIFNLMRSFFASTFAIIIFSLLTSCNSTKDISGIYRSNFAIQGFFVTEITLKQDGSFDYHFQGDAINQRAKGYYEIKERKLYLTYILPTPDTSQYAYFRTIEWSIEEDMKRWSASFPTLFYIKHNKLFDSDKSGKIVKRERPVSIFHKSTERYYLERIQ